MALTVLASCQPGPSPDAEEVPPVTEPPLIPEPADRLTPDGWDGLLIGMTRDEVVAILGEDANPAAVGGPDPETCDEFRPERAPLGMRVMIERGRLTRITLSDPATTETEGGITVGDPADAVRSHFGGRVAATPHKYQAAPAEYLTLWTVGGPGPPDARGMVYEVGVEGRVIHIHAGGPSIQYVEGCL
jgi:hypothetical protein